MNKNVLISVPSTKKVQKILTQLRLKSNDIIFIINVIIRRHHLI